MTGTREPTEAERHPDAPDSRELPLHPNLPVRLRPPRFEPEPEPTPEEVFTDGE